MIWRRGEGWNWWMRLERERNSSISKSLRLWRNWKSQEEEEEKKDAIVPSLQVERLKRCGNQMEKSWESAQGSSQNHTLFPLPKASLMWGLKRGKDWYMPFQMLWNEEEVKWLVSQPLELCPNLLRITEAQRDCSLVDTSTTIFPIRQCFYQQSLPKPNLHVSYPSRLDSNWEGVVWILVVPSTRIVLEFFLFSPRSLWNFKEWKITDWKIWKGGFYNGHSSSNWEIVGSPNG